MYILDVNVMFFKQLSRVSVGVKEGVMGRNLMKLWEVLM